MTTQAWCIAPDDRLCFSLYLSNLVALQGCHLLWELLVGGVTQTQPAVVSVAKREQLSVCSNYSRVFEQIGRASWRERV